MTESRLICCMLPHGAGLPLQTRLFEELRLTRVDLHSARGFIGSDPRALFNRTQCSNGFTGKPRSVSRKADSCTSRD